MTRPLSALLALALFAGAAGCISLPGDLAGDPDVVAAVERVKLRPLRPRIALAPLKLAEPRPANLDGDPTRHPARIDDPAAFAGRLARDLELVLGPVPVVEAGAGGVPSRFEAARRAGADFLLEVEFASFDNVYLGRGAPYLASLLLWGYFPPLSWPVPDEEYGARARGSFHLHGVTSERRLRSVPFEVEVARLLHDFQRGATILQLLAGVFTIPWSLEAKNYQEVGELLNPHALYAVRRACVLDAAGPLLDAFESGELGLRDATTFAAVIAVSSYADPELRAPPGAARDGESVRRLLEARGVPGKNIVSVEGPHATRARVLAALEEIASRARPQDDVLVYFSGLGASAPLPGGGGGAECYLLPHDAARGEIARTSLSLAVLGTMLARMEARSVVVALDAAFGGAGTRSAAPAAAAGAGAALARLSRARPRTSVLAATAPGGDAMDVSAAAAGGARGLFTLALVEGAERAADADQDGRVGLEELAAYLAREIAADAGIEGMRAKPAVFRDGVALEAGVPRRGEESWIMTGSEQGRSAADGLP